MLPIDHSAEVNSEKTHPDTGKHMSGYQAYSLIIVTTDSLADSKKQVGLLRHRRRNGI